jgi:LuxR family maltose regulon positive regulatory protein
MDALIYYDKAGDYAGIISIMNAFPLVLPNNLARFSFDVLERADKTIYRDFPEAIVIRSRILNSLGCYEQSYNETQEIISIVEHFPSAPGKSGKHGILNGCYLNLGFIGLLQSIHTRRYDFIQYFKRASDEVKKSQYITEPPLNGMVLSSYACRIMAPASNEDVEKYIAMIAEIEPYAANAMGGCLHGLFDLCSGEIAFFKTNLKEAEHRLLLSVEKARKSQQYEVENRALFYLLRIYVSYDDRKNIQSVIKQIKAQREKIFFLNCDFYYDIVKGWYHIQTGRKNLIASWLKNDFREGDFNFLLQGLERLIKAKYYVAEKRYPAALAIMQSRQESEAIFIGDIEMKCLEAICRWRMSDKESAFQTLSDAYKIASPSMLFMPFIELGREMRALTDGALKEINAKGEIAGLCPKWLKEMRNKSALYAKKINAHRKNISSAAAACKRDGSRNAPLLSGREMSVLDGLSLGFTRIEIAASLSISPNTVKSALRSIYNKLGALNKADAVRIATEKGIFNVR